MDHSAKLCASFTTALMQLTYSGVLPVSQSEEGAGISSKLLSRRSRLAIVDFLQGRSLLINYY